MKFIVPVLLVMMTVSSCNSEKSEEKESQSDQNHLIETKSITSQLTIKASPEEVWNIITGPEYAIALGDNLKMHCHVESDWQLNSKVYFKRHSEIVDSGVVKEIKENEHILVEYSGNYTESFRLRKVDSSTVLEVSFEAENPNSNYQDGAWLNWLKSVRTIAESNLPKWRKMSCGLFMGPNGEIGFPSAPGIANIPRQAIKSELCACNFLEYIGSQQAALIADVVDTVTFQHLGSSFYKDKNHIYNYYAMCEGGYLNIFADDTSGFEMLGTCYARYQSKIYNDRNGRLNADSETFKCIGCIAKDKNGYFEFDERIDAEILKNNVGEERFEKLESL